MTPDKVEAALGMLRNTIRMSEAQADIDGGKKATQYQRGRADVSRHTANELRDLLSVLTEALAERGWLPIESAPRDGTAILIAGGTWTSDNYDEMPMVGVSIAIWWQSHWRGEDIQAHDDWKRHNPTHWQPLPEPPHDR